MDQKFRLRAGIIFMAFLMFIGMAIAYAAQSNLNSTDKSFIKKAAQDNLAEVAMARVAVNKASSPDVKNFANQMIQDHSSANQKLAEVAKNESITIPSDMGKSNQKEVDKLSKKSGSDFDRAYMDQAVKDHKSDLNEFTKEAKDGKNQALKSYAANMVPALQHHLSMASATDRKVGGKAKA